MYVRGLFLDNNFGANGVPSTGQMGHCPVNVYNVQNTACTAYMCMYDPYNVCTGIIFR